MSICLNRWSFAVVHFPYHYYFYHNATVSLCSGFIWSFILFHILYSVPAISWAPSHFQITALDIETKLTKWKLSCYGANRWWMQRLFFAARSQEVMKYGKGSFFPPNYFRITDQIRATAQLKRAPEGTREADFLWFQLIMTGLWGSILRKWPLKMLCFTDVYFKSSIPR